MISKKIIDAILKSSNNKDRVIREFFKSINFGYDCNDEKQNHLLEMLVDDDTITYFKDINYNYIIENISSFIYEGDKFTYKNIAVDDIDNINMLIRIKYEFKEKDKLNDDSVKYKYSSVTINYKDFPKVLK